MADESEIRTIETVAIIVKLDNGNVHQVLLTDEMIEAIKRDLVNYYSERGVLKLHETALELDLVRADYNLKANG